MTEQNCGTCRYWDTKVHTPNIGACRRYPPIKTNTTIGTYASDWCGEFVPEEDTK